MIYTTFRKAKEARACQSSYRKMAKHLGGISKWGRDNPIPLSNVLEVCGIEDALWAMANCCTESEATKKAAQVFACDCAEHVLCIYEEYAPGDNRPRHAIEVARQYIANETTHEEVEAARDAAKVAARDVWAAWAASRVAAWVAARDVVKAALAAADTGTAWAAEREWQKKRLGELLEQ